MTAQAPPAPIDPRTAAAQVLARCAESGFALSGIAPAHPSAHAAEVIRWLEAGRHGDMHYLAVHVEQRLDPGLKLPGARSIICVADRYAASDGAPEVTPSRHGRIARYARGEDYHRVMKRRLHALCDSLARISPGHQFVACVDTAPVLEREHAFRAGLGYVGKNTMLIEPAAGSYLLLGEIITTLPLEVAAAVHEDHCGTCTRCIDACPTQALTPWSLNATRCISYHTIESRGPVPSEFHTQTGDWIFGCDICQEVCPHNGPTPRTTAAAVHSAYAPRRGSFDLLEVLGWSEQGRRAAFERSALKRASLWMMKRNALIAAGNYLIANDDAALRARILEIAADAHEHEIVCETAAQVLKSLSAATPAGGGGCEGVVAR